MLDFNQPSTKPGYCPECHNKADIWDDKRGAWECVLCNWTGRVPVYQVPRAARERVEYLKIACAGA
jgi:ribosomal protein L37AE/L43A